MMMQKLYQSELKMESVCRAVRTQKNEKNERTETRKKCIIKPSTRSCIIPPRRHAFRYTLSAKCSLHYLMIAV